MRSKKIVVVAVAAAAFAGLAATRTSTVLAADDRPWTGYEYVDRGPANRPENIGPGLIIYMNKNGGTFTPGNDDSRTNRSSVAYSTSTLSAFNCSDAVWQQVMACLTDMYEPYNVTITDVDPGNTPHVESVVAGSPGQLKTRDYPNGLPCGQSGCVGGIAPLGCYGGVDNAIVYSFANIYQCNAQSICETVAQETAHAFGLDHENYCPDPMTYKTGCGAKEFRDYDAPCGEYSNRQCKCPGTGSTQNSHQELLAIFGPGGDDPPSIDFLRPQANQTVTPGFTIEGTASDDGGSPRVELWIDGAMVDSRTQPPYIFDAPASLAGGAHTIQLRAIDSGNQQTDRTINVTLQEPCGGNQDCPTGLVCDLGSGQCLPGPGMPGGLGAPCSDGSECASGLCAQGPDGMRCVEICTPGGSDCPDGFDCLPGGESGACWPGADAIDPPGGDGGEDVTGGCGCATGGAGSRAPALGFLFAFLAACLVARRRR